MLSCRVVNESPGRRSVFGGRSRPGRDVVLRIAAALELPLRSRKELLVAAGLAPEFLANEMGSTVLAPYRRAVLGVMERMNPFPAFAVDAVFNLHELAARKCVTGAALRFLQLSSASEEVQ
jgi:hypothetical protein